VKIRYTAMILSVLLATTSIVQAKTAIADVYLINNNAPTKGMGEKIGTISFQDSSTGLVVQPHLKGLPPGDHGFHIHDKPSCEALQTNSTWEAGMAAGGHLDPKHTQKHLGPDRTGHLGDLPVLVVDQNGNSENTVTAPRLTVKDVVNHSIMIHAGGDNYSDHPPMGGGGARIACGVIK
jgi:Cu-Zn family superoxide dismutase